jgi:hypothetical protein
MGSRGEGWAQFKWMQAGCYALTEGADNRREFSLVMTDEGFLVSGRGSDCTGDDGDQIERDDLGDDDDWD